MKKLIYLEDAIDALGEEPLVWRGSKDEIAKRNQWRRDIKAIKSVPYAQPEKVCIAKITLSEEQLREVVEKAKNEIVQALPSAEPEIIMCKDCIHNGSYDTDCPITWNGKEYCSFAERMTDE